MPMVRRTHLSKQPLIGVGACRYVNGADPNRRRLSYKGIKDAVAAPLKHWHLLEGGAAPVPAVVAHEGCPHALKSSHVCLLLLEVGSCH
jgi:hypothetical protein